MLIKARFPAFVVVLALLSVSSSSYGQLPQVSEAPYPRTKMDRCIEDCRQRVEDVSGLFSCSSRCQEKLGGRGCGKEEEQHEGTVSSLRDPKTPRYEIEKCQEQCQREESGHREMQQCNHRCEEEAIKQREGEQETEQEGQRQQHEQQKEREEEEETGWRHGNVQEVEEKDPELEYEECKEICQKQPGRQVHTCIRRCKRQYEEQRKVRGTTERTRRRQNKPRKRQRRKGGTEG